MAPKNLLVALALCGAMAVAGCTSGHGGGDSTSTSTSGAYGAGGCVTGPNGGVCSNVTASGSASASSTYSSTNSTTNTTTGAPTTATVAMQNSKFVNDSVTIKVGGTVTWEHHDGQTAHTVTSDTGAFDSSPNCAPPVTLVGDCMMDGDTFSFTFDAPGDFAYHCKIHGNSMKGTVHVVA